MVWTWGQDQAALGRLNILRHHQQDRISRSCQPTHNTAGAEILRDGADQCLPHLLHPPALPGADSHRLQAGSLPDARQPLVPLLIGQEVGLIEHRHRRNVLFLQPPGKSRLLRYILPCKYQQGHIHLFQRFFRPLHPLSTQFPFVVEASGIVEEYRPQRMPFHGLGHRIGGGSRHLRYQRNLLPVSALSSEDLPLFLPALQAICSRLAEGVSVSPIFLPPYSQKRKSRLPSSSSCRYCSAFSFTLGLVILCTSFWIIAMPLTLVSGLA